jgi:hypothetical protein
MTRPITLLSDTIPTLMGNMNTVSKNVGDIADVTAGDSDLAFSVNRLDGYVGDSSTALGTTATDLRGAIAEIHANGDSNQTDIQQLDSDVGLLSTLTTTEQGTIVGSINEVKSLIDSAETVVGSLSGLNDSDVAVQTSIVNAINSIAADVTQLGDSGSALDSRIGSLSNLSTFYDSAGATANVIAALNHVGSRSIDVYDSAGLLLNT